MTNERPLDELDLSNAELMEVLKNHGMGRRALMKALGVGTGVAAFGGTATAGSGGGGQAVSRKGNIDDFYGASYWSEETVPNIYDHTVELHTHGKGGDGEHEGFPVPDDAVDADPTTPGFQPDEDDNDDYPEFHFEPVGLHLKPGDVVRFKAETSLHTVTAYDPYFNEEGFLNFPERVPDGPFTSALLTKEDSWLYRFTEKGVYDIQCLPHAFLGMVMRVLVFDPEEDNITDSAFAAPKPDPKAPLSPNAGAVLGDAKLIPENIEDNGKVAWEDLSLSKKPSSIPRPAVDELTLTTDSSSDTVNADWTVSDPKGALNTVELTLREMGGRATTDVACALVSGKKEPGSTDLAADDVTGTTYQVELTVTNRLGFSVTDTANTGGS